MQPSQASPDILNALQSIALAIEASRAAPTNPYKFSAYRNAAVSMTNGVYNKINFDVEDFDTNNNFSSGTYTVPVTGYYHIAWNAGIAITAGNSVAALYKNGVLYRWGNEVSAGGGSGGSVDELLAAGDVLEIYAYVSSTTALGVGNSPKKSYFYGHLISTT